MPLIRQVATEMSPKKQDAEVSLAPVSTLRRPERIKRQRRDKRYQRWAEVDSLHKKAHGIREISRITGLSRVTVRRWMQSKAFPEISTKPPRPGPASRPVICLLLAPQGKTPRGPAGV